MIRARELCTRLHPAQKIASRLTTVSGSQRSQDPGDFTIGSKWIWVFHNPKNGESTPPKSKVPKCWGLKRWNELIRETDERIQKNDRPSAIEQLRRSEAQLVPDVLQGYRWVLTGHRWMALGEVADAQRCCYRRVPQPDDTPAAYGLMRCARGQNPTDALNYAERFEAAMGANPNLTEEKARILEQLDRKSDALNEWKKLLRMQPSDTNALTALIEELPQGDRSGMEPLVNRTENPIATVVAIARSVGYRDYQKIALLIDYLDRTAPYAAGTFYVKGFAKYIDGQYADAAALYRKAFETETKAEDRQSYLNSYIESMIADGNVLDIWKTVPDPKSAFDFLFSSYDEGDIDVTADEIRQVIELYRRQYPNDLEGIYRQVKFDIGNENYTEAEALLRQWPSIATLKDDAKDGTYRDLLANSMATVLFKQGRIQEAYEAAAKQSNGFSLLFRMAVTDQKWNDVRRLVDLHRARNPGDSQLLYAAAELASHERQWDDAIRNYREFMKTATNPENSLSKYRLLEIYVESGRWMEYYKSAEDRNATFNQLANRFASSKNWAALHDLIEEHRRGANDSDVGRYELMSAWEQDNYRVYIDLAQKVLANQGHNRVQLYERSGIENRLLSAFIRSNLLGLARQHAELKLRQENDPGQLAIVEAAAGNWTESNRLARQAALKHKDASILYSNADLAPVFLGDNFVELQREFPVKLPNDAAPTLAVILLDSPPQIEANDVTSALKSMGVEPAPPAQSVPSARKEVTRALAVDVGGGKVWLATGQGKYFAQPRFLGDNASLQQVISNSPGWLAVGVAGLRDLDRKLAENLAKRVASQLTAGHSSAIWLPGRISIYPASSEIISAWISSSNLDAFKDQAITMIQSGETEAVENREFNRKLFDAVHTFESSPGKRLELKVCNFGDTSLDPLLLRVTSVRRTYGYLEFDGILTGTSSLIPQLREGLPMRFEGFSVSALRLNDETPVYRHPNR